MGFPPLPAAAEVTNTMWQTGTCCWIQRHNNKITSLPDGAGLFTVLLATSPRPWRATCHQPDTPVVKGSFCAPSRYFVHILIAPLPAPDHKNSLESLLKIGRNNFLTPPSPP